LINKLKFSHILHLWSTALFTTGDGEDHMIFKELLKHPDFGETGIPTVNCAIDPADDMHEWRTRDLPVQIKNREPKFQSLR
jgi:hypothetical protein